MQDLNSDHCPVELIRQNLIKTVWKEFEEILRNYSPLCEILNEDIDAVLEDLSAAVKEALKASRLELSVQNKQYYLLLPNIIWFI